MFNHRQVKFPRFIVSGMAATVLLVGCGQAPGTVGAVGTQAKASQTGTLEAQTRYNVAAIVKAIKAKIEKNIPDHQVTLHDVEVFPLAQIAIYPPPPVTVLGFRAKEQVIGFAGPAFTQWFAIEGTYDLRTGAVKVTRRVNITR